MLNFVETLNLQKKKKKKLIQLARTHVLDSNCKVALFIKGAALTFNCKLEHPFVKGAAPTVKVYLAPFIKRAALTLNSNVKYEIIIN